MIRKTSAVLLLQRTDWFESTKNEEALIELNEDADRVVLQLTSFLDILCVRSISTPQTAEAVSVELRSLDTDLIILVYQTRIDHTFLEKVLLGVGNRPLIVWCYLPWRKVPRPITYEMLVKGASFSNMAFSLAHLREMGVPHFAVFGSVDDPHVIQAIKTFSHAAQISCDIHRIKLGILTPEIARDYNLEDQTGLILGIQPIFVPFSLLSETLLKITEEQVNRYLEDLQKISVESMITVDTLRKAARIQVGLACLADTMNLDFLAIPRHDPVFRQQFGICAGLPPARFLRPEPFLIPSTDPDAIAASVILDLIGCGQPCFLMEMWFYDQAKNIVVGGSGGAQSPFGISDEELLILGDYECQRGDPDGGAQIEFITRPGRVTLLQIQKARDKFRAIGLSGVCLESVPWVEGIPHAVVRLDCNIDKLLDRISTTGGSRFWTMIYGSHLTEIRALFDLLAIEMELLSD
ncbi:hypothetical protein ATHL_01320 [Anaerolinea thermolimosa]|uniref:hypothetical protein n=1 Tax=Anaerolinea thermolimosa TaxID=229919 RepID=UPI0007862082|nr:hypothetical protein [Anaerolinea thermolimosa]GAP06466.1 hypothetical protein ATHL_01320 [Anaerolinea thermolimosa]